MNDQQRTREWFLKRVGKLTASNMESAMDFNKTGKESEKRANLKLVLIAERLTGEPSVTPFISKPMQHGIETESIAKNVLSQHGYKIEEIDFVDHPIIKKFGASPDGLLGDGGVLEIKCPNTETHIKWMMEGVVPEKHKPQMLAQISCTGRGWAEFVSFDDRIDDPALRLFIRRYEPSFEEIKAVEEAAKQFLWEVDKLHGLLLDAYS